MREKIGLALRLFGAFLAWHTLEVTSAFDVVVTQVDPYSALVSHTSNPPVYATALWAAPEELKLYGQTDAEGRFLVALPWPKAFASGRLRSPNGPLSHISFHLFLRFKSAGPQAPEGIAGFRVEVPGFLPRDIDRFTIFSSEDLRQFFLGEVEVEEAEIFWDPARPLSWEDFRGDPPPGPHREGAQIHLSLSWNGEWELRFDRERRVWVARLVSINTFNTMDRGKSWALPYARTVEALNHEQRHFDLNEVYRRLLDLALRKLLGTEVTGATRDEAEGKLKALLNALFERTFQKCQEMQSRYDRETDYGRNWEKQREWDRMISEWLLDPLRAPQP